MIVDLLSRNIRSLRLQLRHVDRANVRSTASSQLFQHRFPRRFASGGAVISFPRPLAPRPVVLEAHNRRYSSLIAIAEQPGGTKR